MARWVVATWTSASSTYSIVCMWIQSQSSLPGDVESRARWNPPGSCLLCGALCSSSISRGIAWMRCMPCRRSWGWMSLTMRSRCAWAGTSSNPRPSLGRTFGWWTQNWRTGRKSCRIAPTSCKWRRCGSQGRPVDTGAMTSYNPTFVSRQSASCLSSCVPVAQATLVPAPTAQHVRKTLSTTRWIKGSVKPALRAARLQLDLRPFRPASAPMVRLGSSRTRPCASATAMKHSVTRKNAYRAPRIMCFAALVPIVLRQHRWRMGTSAWRSHQKRSSNALILSIAELHLACPKREKLGSSQFFIIHRVIEFGRSILSILRNSVLNSIDWSNYSESTRSTKAVHAWSFIV